MTSLLLLADPIMGAHSQGPLHPEDPARLDACLRALRGVTLPASRWAAGRDVTRDELARLHDPAYVDAVERARGEARAFDVDVTLSAGSVPAAVRAAGASLSAVEEVCAGAAKAAFALVRPPGHHAERGRAMGFCVYNNVALAAAHAIAALGCARVLIIDWDVHHGNGTQHLFERRDDVLVFNTHQSPHYPGTGAAFERGHGPGEGYTVNVPLPPGMGDGDYAAVFDELLAPIAEQFAPELVLVSAGFDAHRDDPLGDMRVTDEGFATLCARAQAIADAHAGGRLVLLLEGGYDLDGLARSVVACARVLVGEAAPPPRPQSAAIAPVLRAARDVHGARWRL